MNPSRPQTAVLDPFRPWLLAGATALVVARVLLPSDGTNISAEGPLLVLLTLVLLAAWSLRAVMRRGAAARFGIVDVALVALVAWHSISALVAMRDAAPRAAVHAAWAWIGLAAGFVLIRQLLRTEREARALAAAMIALAVALSTFGYHQFFISMPADRALYARDPEEALRQAHVLAPPESRQRLLFEQRVNSTEPMATFALANSLAGFLAPWLIVSAGIAATAWVARTKDLRLWLPAIACAVLILGCLALTKSRAATLATGVGALGLFAWAALRGARVAWYWVAAPVAAVAAIVALVGAGAVWAGALDREVFSEAGKSLGYRWQYWQATLRMIADHPWLGCGPGQFQNRYTLYKLPEASEVVADPHNFLFELWGTAGTPAALALLAVIALSAWRLLRPTGTGLVDDASLSPESARGAQRTPAGADASRHVLAGGVAGFVLALAIGPMATVPLTLAAFVGGLFVAALAAGALYPWVARGQLNLVVPALAALVLLINLLAAGGISFAGVAGSLWLLGGLCLAMAEAPRRLSLPGAIPLLAVALALAGACYVTEYQPLLAGASALNQADADPQHAEKHLGEAAKADPLSAEPWKRLVALDWARWRRHPTQASFDRAVAAADEAVKLEPYSAALIESKGELLFEAAKRNKTPGALALAIEAFRQAADLHPSSIPTRTNLALALAESHDGPEAAREAAEALRLDELTPHKDQKLPPDMRKRLQTLVTAP